MEKMKLNAHMFFAGFIKLLLKTDAKFMLKYIYILKTENQALRRDQWKFILSEFVIETVEP